MTIPNQTPLTGCSSCATLRAERDEAREAANGNKNAYVLAYDRLGAAEARSERLEAALRGGAHAVEVDGMLCWCAYFRLVHPANDPQDAIDLEPNGHTKECNFARAALADEGPLPADTKEGA